MSITLEPSALLAARLVYKGLQPKLVPANDKEYRDLLALYEARAPFRALVEEVAQGLELEILDINPDGAFFVAASLDSRFSFRLGDLTSSVLGLEEKAQFVLILTTIATMFYPTADRLADDSIDPPPATEAETLNVLKTVCHQCQRLAKNGDTSLPKELEPGWKSILEKPEARPEAGRRTRTSLDGLVSAVYRELVQHGLVRLDSDEGPSPRYTATKRFTAQLRANSMHAIFKAARAGVAREGFHDA